MVYVLLSTYKYKKMFLCAQTYYLSQHSFFFIAVDMELKSEFDALLKEEAEFGIQYQQWRQQYLDWQEQNKSEFGDSLNALLCYIIQLIDQNNISKSINIFYSVEKKFWQLKFNWW